jgi:hypothetical protein
MTKKFYDLQNNDIITKTEGNSREEGNAYPFFTLESDHSSTYRVEEIINATKTAFQKYFSSYVTQIKLISEGVECELMKNNGGGWKKGKFRLKMSLEFCPDEPDEQTSKAPEKPKSVLDDIRQSLNDVSG